jgi:hypothetical protein
VFGWQDAFRTSDELVPSTAGKTIAKSYLLGGG